MAAGKNLGAFPASFVASIRDNTGETITVTTAGTPLPLKGATFLERRNPLDGASGFVWSATDGEVTIGAQAAGVYDVEVIPGRTIGTDAGVKILRVSKNGTGVGGLARTQEAATAVGAGMGSAFASGVSLEAGDKVGVLCDVGTNGHVVTAMDLSLKLTRVG